MPFHVIGAHCPRHCNETTVHWQGVGTRKMGFDQWVDPMEEEVFVPLNCACLEGLSGIRRRDYIYPLFACGSCFVVSYSNQN